MTLNAATFSSRDGFLVFVAGFFFGIAGNVRLRVFVGTAWLPSKY